jgi:hypothetical protein
MHTPGVGDRFPRLKRKNPPTIDDRGDVLIVAPKLARDHHGETKTKLMLHTPHNVVLCVLCKK